MDGRFCPYSCEPCLHLRAIRHNGGQVVAVKPSLYLKNYGDGRGIPLKVKAATIAILWLTILISALFFVTILLVQIILMIIAAAVTIHVLLIKTYRED